MHNPADVLDYCLSSKRFRLLHILQTFWNTGYCYTFNKRFGLLYRSKTFWTNVYAINVESVLENWICIRRFELYSQQMFWKKNAYVTNVLDYWIFKHDLENYISNKRFGVLFTQQTFWTTVYIKNVLDYCAYITNVLNCITDKRLKKCCKHFGQHIHHTFWTTAYVTNFLGNCICSKRFG